MNKRSLLLSLLLLVGVTMLTSMDTAEKVSNKKEMKIESVTSAVVVKATKAEAVAYIKEQIALGHSAVEVRIQSVTTVSSNVAPPICNNYFVGHVDAANPSVIVWYECTECWNFYTGWVKLYCVEVEEDE